MTKPRRFRPSAQPLEGRLALSFSFDSLIHSVLPFIHNDHTEAVHKPRVVDTGTFAPTSIVGAAATRHPTPFAARRLHHRR